MLRMLKSLFKCKVLLLAVPSDCEKELAGNSYSEIVEGTMLLCVWLNKSHYWSRCSA